MSPTPPPGQKGQRLSGGAWFIIITLVLLLAVSLWMAVDVWVTADRATVEGAARGAAEGHGAVSGHGIMALVLGGIGTLIVGGGLMALVFFSSRSGHDDAVHEETRTRVHPDDDPLSR